MKGGRWYLADIAPASRSPAVLTPRDENLFRALTRAPLTVRQLLKVSSTFDAPFTSERRLQDRLHRLWRGRLLRRWQYATTELGAQYYYTLSPESYRLLHGADVRLPNSRAFGPVGLARQHHTRALADFIVHTTLAAHAAAVSLTDFHRENSLCLSVRDQHLYPDCSFTLAVPGRPLLRFYVELDNGTEPLTSARERESWEQKLRFYEAYHQSRRERFRVLGLVTRSRERLQNVVETAARTISNPRRVLFYAICLRDYLAQEAPLHTPCFLDQRGAAAALVPYP